VGKIAYGELVGSNSDREVGEGEQCERTGAGRLTSGMIWHWSRTLIWRVEVGKVYSKSIDIGVNRRENGTAGAARRLLVTVSKIAD
jgi:hypothetical protein